MNQLPRIFLLHSHWLILILPIPCIIQSLINYYCINHIPYLVALPCSVYSASNSLCVSWYTCLLISQLISRVPSSVEKASSWDFPAIQGLRRCTFFNAKGTAINPWLGSLDSTCHTVWSKEKKALPWYSRSLKQTLLVPFPIPLSAIMSTPKAIDGHDSQLKRSNFHLRLCVSPLWGISPTTGEYSTLLPTVATQTRVEVVTLLPNSQPMQNETSQR